MKETQLGDIVLYQLTDIDAYNLNLLYVHDYYNPKGGYQVHVGSPVSKGDVVPMIVTKVWSSICVNGQVILDGNDSLWMVRIDTGEGPGYWIKRT